MSLKQRLLAFVACLLVVVVAVLSVLSYQRMRTEIIEGVRHELDAAMLGNRNALGNWLAQRKDAVEATASLLVSSGDVLPQLQQGKAAGRFDQLFAGYADKRMVYQLADKHAPEGYDPTARPWYKQAAAAGASIVTEPYLFASTKKLGVTVAIPCCAISSCREWWAGISRWKASSAWYRASSCAAMVMLFWPPAVARSWHIRQRTARSSRWPK
ncbi:hypothetical protein [Aquitalea magnusonii]|uniref:PDC sensor domain-containing protein n=1 Tax=Aquitalea magnusonii TaxID=332411 RepID=UPI00075019D2|nr:hypothetical protein [Aquitalea magnusonii]